MRGAGGAGRVGGMTSDMPRMVTRVPGSGRPRVVAPRATREQRREWASRAGVVCAALMTPEQRRARARTAALARWGRVAGEETVLSELTGHWAGTVDPGLAVVRMQARGGADMVECVIDSRLLVAEGLTDGSALVCRVILRAGKKVTRFSRLLEGA